MAEPGRTIIRVGAGENAVSFGAVRPVLIAGPCSIESEEQFCETACFLKKLGVPMVRGGAFKPRTSPFSFQGLGLDGLRILSTTCRKLGLLSVTEVLDPRHIELVADHADVLQVGSRNMANYALLQEVGKAGKPVMLKRGFMATIKEFLLAAEYILQDTPEVILCERGIRTFEEVTRFTLDLNAIPVIKKMSPLPIIVDPSHGTGRADIVLPMSKAALACGADGLMVEVHPNPTKAKSDGAQTLSFTQFQAYHDEISAFLRAIEASRAGEA